MRSAALRVRGVSVDDLVDSYWIFLARNGRDDSRYSAHLDRFKLRYQSDTHAAEAEAVVFSLLWSAKLRPDIYESHSTGGPDFVCRPETDHEFVVEVTSLQSGSVSRKSHLPETIDGSGGGAFGLITSMLKGRATAKAAQLRGVPVPRVLAITCSHICGDLLMDSYAAVNLMVSEPYIRVPFGDQCNATSQVTDLRNSVFIRPDKSSGQIVPCRQSISAILLVSISGNRSDVVGLLHPEPTITFNPSLFPLVPYLSLVDWPIRDGRIRIRWLPDTSDAAVFYHARIR